jgi:prolyl 4-hydroxylase
MESIPPVAPNALIYNGEIGITVLDNFISEEEKEDVLSFFEEMEKSTVCTEDGEGEQIEARTGYRKWIDHTESLTFFNMCSRIAQFAGTELSHAEKVQLLHYRKGEKYDPHFDAFDQSSEQWNHYNRGGQRIYTAMVYLSDVVENGGGETSFPVLGYSIRPRAKRLLVFSNVGNDTTKPHPDSLHGGMPVKEGEKKCFTLWFREKPINEV